MESLIFELYEGLDRKGPGSPETTRRALECIGHPDRDLSILDVGCGAGEQSLELARNCDGSIIATDIYQPFLDALMNKSRQSSLRASITTRCCSMDALDFPEHSFDIIWSEGAIYIMGFEAGLRQWKPLLKRDGFLAVTELSWLTEHPPLEVQHYWNREYPAMGSIQTNKERILAQGYAILDTFVLPEACWWQHFYAPLTERMAVFRQSHAGNPEAELLCASTAEEMELYRRFSDSYGYVFYVMQATD